jgi:hypothetical protein
VTAPADRPPANVLADEHDQDGWDRDRFGSFADYATADDAVTTVPADEYLQHEDGR